MREQIYRLRNNQPGTEFQKILLQSVGGDKNEQNGNKKRNSTEVGQARLYNHYPMEQGVS